MSDRTTPYVHGNRIGPDIAALVAKYPRRCTVHYRRDGMGNWYKYMRCAHCKQWYWRRYGPNTTSVRASTTNPEQTYCSEACALEGHRAHRRARQARWIAKHPDKAKALRRAINRRHYLTRRK